MASRRKAARIEAPATIEDATRMIAEYLELGAQNEATKAMADKAIRDIEAARDLQTAPFEARMKDLFMQLRTWWTVARIDLTEGKRKSYELAGAILGDRIGTPALKLPKGMKADDAVDAVLDEFSGDFLITKHSLDKIEIVKTLRLKLDPEDPQQHVERWQQETLAEKIGFGVTQKEEFFIDRAAPKDADPIVETATAELAA